MAQPSRPQTQHYLPSLIDRLKDDEPQATQDAFDQRSYTPERLRDSVKENLEWLLNTGHLASVQDLSAYPHVKSSVVNFGVPDLNGLTATSVITQELERSVREAIVLFEPRILPQSVRVTAVLAKDEMNRNALGFVIEGQLWGQPAPYELLVRTEVSNDTGQVTIQEYKTA